MCVHVFPLSCVYHESQQSLFNSDDFVDAENVETKQLKAKQALQALSKFEFVETEHSNAEAGTTLDGQGENQQILHCVICFSDFKQGD